MIDPDRHDSEELLVRVLEALERLVVAAEEISAKIDKANESLEQLNRSQWA